MRYKQLATGNCCGKDSRDITVIIQAILDGDDSPLTNDQFKALQTSLDRVREFMTLSDIKDNVNLMKLPANCSVLMVAMETRVSAELAALQAYRLGQTQESLQTAIKTLPSATVKPKLNAQPKKSVHKRPARASTIPPQPPRPPTLSAARARKRPNTQTQ